MGQTDGKTDRIPVPTLNADSGLLGNRVKEQPEDKSGKSKSSVRM